MRYNNLAITITDRQAGGYPVSAVDQEVGRVSYVVRPASPDLTASIDALVEGPRGQGGVPAAKSVGVGLFRWLTEGPLEAHLRLAWDRAQRAGRGLRLRLSIDPPDISSWPWELLHDPVRDHSFAASVGTPLVRYYDQTATFGALLEPEAEMPLDVLLVVPASSDLDLDRERHMVEEALTPLVGALTLHVLEGVVTRKMLAGAIRTGQYDVLHISGHGGFSEGQGYVGLHGPSGEPDWLDGTMLARICSSHSSLRLVVLNVCSSGRVDAGVPFQGIPPQLVRGGVPAVVAMQYSLDDAAAALFAREFYHQLCLGDDAGHVDIAVTHARSVLAVNRDKDWSYAVPVLFTHSADSVLFAALQEPEVSAIASAGQWAKQASFMASLEQSLAFDEDWSLADVASLTRWQQILRQAEQNYQLHASDRNDQVRRAANYGLDIVRARLSILTERLAALRQDSRKALQDTYR